ncbi:MAG: phosphoribosyl-AMP cyclohydrolase [Candidatus Sumerlaeia bacterium]
MSIADLLTAVRFDDNGLAAAVVQDADSGEVLMMAFVNRTAVEKTLETGLMHFWSRSRRKLWMKGETSGHTQEVREVRLDCDGDALLFKVKQNVAACHTGYRSCFYRVMRDGLWLEEGKRLFDPDDVY